MPICEQAIKQKEKKGKKEVKSFKFHTMYDIMEGINVFMNLLLRLGS